LSAKLFGIQVLFTFNEQIFHSIVLHNQKEEERFVCVKVLRSNLKAKKKRRTTTLIENYSGNSAPCA
jgi:hypothetical protein